MSSINSDYMSQMVLQSLSKTDADMTRAMQRLSTGKRINQAADDAAGLSIASKLKAQVNGLNAAMKNASDANAMVGTIEGIKNNCHPTRSFQRGSGSNQSPYVMRTFHLYFPARMQSSYAQA